METFQDILLLWVNTQDLNFKICLYFYRSIYMLAIKKFKCLYVAQIPILDSLHGSIFSWVNLCFSPNLCVSQFMHGNLFTFIPRIVPTTLEPDLCMGQSMHGDLCPATFLHLDMHDKVLHSHQKCVGRFFAFIMFRMCPPLTSLSKFLFVANFLNKNTLSVTSF